MKLSIIVPVYNVESYIERCLRSLIKQDISEKDYEIIVVNDGSPDNSREIVLRLQLECKNLILIEQENMGVSVARNKAIDSAKGKYIIAIDPDDYVVEDSLAKYIEIADCEELDVLYLGYSVFNEDGVLVWQSNYQDKENKLFSGIEVYNATHGKGESHPDHSVAIIYKKDFIEKYHLRYPVRVPYLEDGLFIGKVLSVAQKCAFITEPFYMVTTRPGSAMNSDIYSGSKARNGFIKAAADICDFSKTVDLDPKQSGLVNHVMAKFVLTSVISSISSHNFKALISTKRLISENGFSKLEINGLFETKTDARLFNISFWLFVGYYIFQTRVGMLKKFIASRQIKI